MAYSIDTVEVWAGPIDDRPGGVAETLQCLADAGANLEFVIGRRDTKAKGVLFCAPLKGGAQLRAAKKSGMAKSESLRSLRVEGPDTVGLGGRMTKALGEAGVNIRGVSGAALRHRAVFYFAFDSRKDATKARRVLKKVLGVK